MPITNEQEYQSAQSVYAAGSAKDMPRLLAAIQGYEKASGIDDAPEEAPPTPLESPKVAARTAQLQRDVPAAGPTGYWKPQRELGAMDFVPQDTGGNLAMWRDMPLDIWKERVAGPAKQAAVAKALQAKLTMQQMGPMVPPDQMPMLVQALAEGQQAETTDLDSLTEEDSRYRQFNDGEWQKAVEERAKDPSAGPIQRLEKLKTDNLFSAGNVAYGIEKGKDLATAGLRGALDLGTLGLGAGAMDALNEAVGGREAATVQRDLQTAHPIASAAGSIGAGLAAPLSAGGSLARMLYAGAKPALGRWGAGAAAGAATAATEGLGKDVSQEAADAISDAPEAELEMGRLEPGRLATNTGIRAGVGAAGGLMGEGVAGAGEGLRRWLALRAMKTPGSPSAYQKLEASGYDFDPVKGVVVPPGVQDAMRKAEARGGGSWAEDFAERAKDPLIDAVNAADTALQTKQAGEVSQYLDSTSVAKPATATWGALRSALKTVDSPQRAAVTKKLVEWSDIDPASGPPPKNWGQKFYMQAGQLRSLRAAEAELTPDAQATAGLLEELPDEAWVILKPRKLAASDFYAKKQTLNQLAAEADSMKDGMLASVWRKADAGALQDRSRFPETKSVKGLTATVERPGAEPLKVKGFSALQARQSDELHAMQTDRQLTDVRGASSAARALPDDAAAVTKTLRNQGRAGFPVAKEAALDKYLPAELKQEALLLRGANLAEAVGGTAADPSISRTGVLNAARDFAKPRVYGLGRALSADVSGLGAVGKHQSIALPDNYPISPRFFSWISSRMPRALVPGMNIAAEIGRMAEIKNKPTPNVGDLTPEQKAFLQEMLQ